MKNITNLGEEFEIVSLFGWASLHVVLIICVQPCALKLMLVSYSPKTHHIENIVDIKLSQMIWENGPSEIAVTA